MKHWINVSFTKKEDIGKINRLVVIGIDYFPFYTETRGRHGRIANTQQGQQETKTLLHFLHWFVNNATKIGFSYERNRIFAYINHHLAWHQQEKSSSSEQLQASDTRSLNCTASRDGGSGLPDGGRNCSQKSGRKHLTRSKRHK